MAALDKTRQVDLELTLSLFRDERVIQEGGPGSSNYVGPPGLGAYYSSKEGETAGLMFCCPGDGYVASIGFKPNGDKHQWSWNGNREKPTCKPSIQCTRLGCGWHGWLTDGRFHL